MNQPSVSSSIPRRLGKAVYRDFAASFASKIDLWTDFLSSSLNRILIGLVVGSQLADLTTTLLALRKPGTVEANPIGDAAISMSGSPGIVFVKLVVIGVVLWNLPQLGRRQRICLIVAASLVGLAAAAWNLHFL